MLKLIIIGLAIGLVWKWFLKPASKPARVAPPPPPSPVAQAMAVDEARSILGLGADADDEAVRAAHRRLVAAVHPDKGGSADLTRRINMARDTLLRG
ncbi:J domain-containing protein [Sphingomonas sp. RS6]